MKFFPKNLVADTVGLKTDEIGAYMLLICKAWDADGKLPCDIDYLSRITGAKPAVVRSVIQKLSPSKLVIEDDGFLRFQMVDLDLNRVAKIKSANSENGKRSAEIKRLRIVGGDE